MAKQKPTPEQVVEQLRAVRSQIEDDITYMTPQQRRDLRDRTKHSAETIAAASNAIGMSGKVQGAIGMSSGEVKDLVALTDRWVAVEGDLRAMLNGVTSANIKRRHQLALIADQVFAVTKQLLRSPGNEDLRTIFEDMKRLRNLERQKKTRKPPEEV
ncbi:MAG TPA: hypothetical protein VGJ82_11050 [Thermoanaerobaculia bacterium]